MSEQEREGKSKASVRAVSRAEARETGMPRDVLIALHETEGVGRVSIAAILLYGVMKGKGALRHSRDFLAGDWRDMGLSPRQAFAIEANLRSEAKALRELRPNKDKTAVVTYLDEGYPEMLTHISDPPWVLYCIGRRELFEHPAIAIVGTRMATGYGRKAAETIAAGCSRRMTVVSGLARGIDAAAHASAVSAACGTIAVLAGPVDRCYPPENQALYREIAARGLIVSESPPGTALRPGLFPLRNRIIAGLSYGVVVVEAARRSGALITADLALGYNRDVFVVPGQVTSPRSQGALEYFRKGAHPALDATDIFAAYEHRLPAASLAGQAEERLTEPLESTENLTREESRIYDFLMDGPSSVDDLAALSGMTFGHLHSVLLSLLLKQRIQQLPGSVYYVL
ncbi:DNA-processing protein DprA [Cohnella boryungensis]|uniref:DNA-processing protein DprA n=1 Tax=Cohnella boryungensis TaxID=768479 RepID=A0ABV8SJF4_9BACL